MSAARNDSKDGSTAQGYSDKASFPHVPLRLLVTTAALTIVIARAIWPNLFARIDGVALGLLAAAAVPWLAPLVRSIEVMGVGKVELTQLEQQVRSMEGRLESTETKASTAETAATRAQLSSQPVTGPDRPARVESELRRLADEYNEIRKTQKRGALRTANMTRLVTEMMPLARNLPVDKTIEYVLTDDDDWGIRLAGYAASYTNPSDGLAKPLVKSLVDVENKNFNQYWCIRAIQNVIKSSANQSTLLSGKDIDKLRRFLSSLKPTSDRYYELKKILDSVFEE